jgi:hypothetical protein
MLLAIILLLALIYLIAGFIFLFPFLFKGIHAVDEGAHGSSNGFYIIIIPGIVLLWPLLLKKWMQALRQRTFTKPAETIETP